MNEMCKNNYLEIHQIQLHRVIDIHILIMKEEPFTQGQYSGVISHTLLSESLVFVKPIHCYSKEKQPVIRTAHKSLNMYVWYNPGCKCVCDCSHTQIHENNVTH